MLKLLPVLLILTIVAVVISCKPTKDIIDTTPDIVDSVKDDIKEAEENNPDELMGFTWSVNYLQELDARFLAEKAISITFGEENKASIVLSVNSCVATYKATGTTLKITEEGCTEACCDDDFDKQLLSLIRGNEFSYQLNGSKLVLNTSTAKIVLSKK